ncbi:MAG TPA: sulfatase [Planctomycetota bacterium]|nr:sulfatase [Planctomycetota bacterium]
MNASTNRREFLGESAAAVAGAAIAPAVLEAAQVEPKKAPKQPNILLFLVDDMGWQDTSVPFHSARTPLNDKFRTPSMERLAATGVKFTQAYACCVCSPTRVSLMCGLNAARHRVTNWTLHHKKGPDAKHPTLAFPAWNTGGLCMQPGVERTVHAVTFPSLLREAGYRTIHVGKAHLGAVDTPGADPRNLGFEVNIAGHAAGGPGSYLGTQNFSAAWRKGDRVWDVPGLDAYHGKDIFLTEALTLEALKQLDKAANDGAPFFLYMSHYAVHVPFAPDKRFVQRYRDVGLDDTEAMYAAIVEGMDKSLGDLLAWLDRTGLASNTAVLFMSDNGGLSAHGRGGRPHTHNAPLSSGKGSAHEGGIREPMIVRWPGVTVPGTACDRRVIIEDFFPTVLDMAGVTGWQDKAKVDGVSFAPLLREGGTRPDRPFFWHYPNNWGPSGPGIGPHSAIRKGDWKLIYYHANRGFELFNVAADIGETTNLADDQPERLSSMSAELTAYLASVSAQMPADKRTGRPVPLPTL